MPPIDIQEVKVLEIALARLETRFDAIDKRLNRIETLIFGTVGTAGVGLLFALITHSIHIP